MQKHQVRRRMRVEQNGSFADYLMLTFRALDFFFVLNFLTFFFRTGFEDVVIWPPCTDKYLFHLSSVFPFLGQLVILR